MAGFERRKNAVIGQIALALYCVGLVLVPVSSGTKVLLGFPEITWINPTLLVAALLLVLIRPMPRPWPTILLLATTVASMLGGVLLLGRGHSADAFHATYQAAREPIRLTLNLAWLWLCIHFLERDPRTVVRWFGIGVLLQFLLAAVLCVGALGLVPLPDLAASFADEAFVRQNLSFGAYRLPRLVGTFHEGPPFGLFMLSALAVLSLAIRAGQGGPFLWLCWVTALLGALGSGADQVFLGMIVFAAALLWDARRNGGPRSMQAALAVVLVVLGSYVATRLSPKVAEAIASVPVAMLGPAATSEAVAPPVQASPDPVEAVEAVEAGEPAVVAAIADVVEPAAPAALAAQAVEAVAPSPEAPAAAAVEVAAVETEEELRAARRAEVYGRSGAERTFHLRYALSILREIPLAIPFGIGPGRYGEYAVRTEIFPSTVTLQIVPLEWLVEFGLIGLIVIVLMQLWFLRAAHAAYGWLGTAFVAALILANFFQANWKFEAWFLALAYASMRPGSIPAQGEEREAAVAKDPMALQPSLRPSGQAL